MVVEEEEEEEEEETMATGEAVPSFWSGSVKGQVAAPISKVWNLTSGLGPLSSCDILEGQNNVPGCVRLLIGTLPDGSQAQIFEQLQEVDEDKYLVGFKIEGDNPLAGLRGTFKLLKDGQDSTQVEWSYQLADAADSHLVSRNAYGFYHACIESLKALVE